jgi:phosphoglycolate phosphatase
MNVFFDLDGTLIDSKLRLYKLFQFLVPSSNLTYDAYWGLKQQKISNQVILTTRFGYSEAMLKTFLDKWMQLIEHQDYLKFDKVIDGVGGVLQTLQQQADLYVCTARQHQQATLVQLEALGLNKFFKKTFITEQKFSKNELITSSISNLSSSDWFVGDTGHDIQVGKKLNINTCAVMTGFLSADILSEYQPDVLLESVVDFSKIVNVNTI